MGAAPAGDAGAVLAGLALLPCGLGRGPQRRRQHGPAGRAGHVRSLWAERVAARPVLDGRQRHAASIFRGVGGRYHPGAAGQVAGGPRQAAGGRGHPGARAAPAGARLPAPSRRHRSRSVRQRRAPRRPAGDPPRRAHPRRRHRARGAQPRRREPPDRREPARPQGAGQPRRWRRSERRRPAAGGGNGLCRGGHAGPHRPAGGGGAGRQGADPARGGPGGGRLRAGRARRGGADLPGLVAAGARRAGRHPERRSGAGDRLPLRPGPGDAHRHHGGHRRRGAGRHPDPQCRGAGSGAPHRDRGVRQDGHLDRRQAPGRGTCSTASVRPQRGIESHGQQHQPSPLQPRHRSIQRGCSIRIAASVSLCPSEFG